MSTSVFIQQKVQVPMKFSLSLDSLVLLNTYLDELVREEHLNQSAQVVLRRIALPVCALAGKLESLYYDTQHPARKILETTVKIAKLSGNRFEPGEVLYQTVSESIKELQAKNVKPEETLARLQGDLESVLRLAKIRVPATIRQSAEDAGKISAAKIVASLIVLGHARRFDADESIVYFCLTEWFELIVVTVLQFGAESKTLKELDRMTFTLFYLHSGKSGDKYETLLEYMLGRFDELLKTLAPVCAGHRADFRSLKRNLSKILKVARFSRSL